MKGACLQNGSVIIEEFFCCKWCYDVDVDWLFSNSEREDLGWVFVIYSPGQDEVTKRGQKKLFSFQNIFDDFPIVNSSLK